MPSKKKERYMKARIEDQRFTISDLLPEILWLGVTGC